MIFYERMPWRLRVKISAFILKRKNVEAGKYFSFIKKIPLIINRGRFQIGDDTRFDYYTRLSTFDIREGGSLVIGSKCYINEGANFCSSLSITIGDNTLVGPNVYILDSDLHQITPTRNATTKPVTIGRNCWIGASVIILPGAVIGDHSVIGAGSVVKGEIPARCIATGNPARPGNPFEAPDGWIRK